MQKLVLENFGKFRETLVEGLVCEDYEDEGLLELQQLQEAISTVNEDLEQSVLDYMLYYVMMRSAHVEKMEYKTLIKLIDSLMESQSQSRVQSASRKNRPESSSPEKLKLRNPQKAAAASQQKPPSNEAAEVAAEDEDDRYSDEEIANDPDEEDGNRNETAETRQEEQHPGAIGKAAEPLNDEDDEYRDEDDGGHSSSKQLDNLRDLDALDDDDDNELPPLQDGGEHDEERFEESPRPKVSSQG